MSVVTKCETVQPVRLTPRGVSFDWSIADRLYVNGASIEDLCQVTGYSPATVRQHVYRHNLDDLRAKVASAKSEGPVAKPPAKAEQTCAPEDRIRRKVLERTEKLVDKAPDDAKALLTAAEVLRKLADRQPSAKGKPTGRPAAADLSDPEGD